MYNPSLLRNNFGWTNKIQGYKLYPIYWDNTNRSENAHKSMASAARLKKLLSIDSQYLNYLKNNDGTYTMSAE